MHVASIWSRLVQGITGGNSRDLPGILSESECRRFLTHERALADRHARHFALLIFAPPAARNSGSVHTALLAQLKHRLRETDVVGWMEKGRMGAILPACDQAGARSVAEAVCAGMQSCANGTAYELHTYPVEASIDAGGRHRMMALVTHPLPRYKRLLDVAVAAIGLVLVSPLLLLVATVVKLASPGPAFFKQERVGHLGARFLCWKFRTMTVAADSGVHRQHVEDLMQAGGPMVKLDQGRDARLIPFGRLLRAAGLDELPQLYNVLRGEMSVVGPRPCVPYEYNTYQHWHKRRFDALPGLTGLWQVSGKNRTTFGQMMRLDVAYARRQTLPHDFHIIWRTLPVLVEQVQNMLPRRESKLRAEATLPRLIPAAR